MIAIGIWAAYFVAVAAMCLIVIWKNRTPTPPLTASVGLTLADDLMAAVEPFGNRVTETIYDIAEQRAIARGSTCIELQDACDAIEIFNNALAAANAAAAQTLGSTEACPNHKK